jgi:2,4-dienoyl-CoA reductase-like NADH-dependent reductase (Old Yellow Enzyme family)
MPSLFDSYTLRSITLRNRVVMSPMCMYVAGEDAIATDFHLVHLGARAVGGVGLIVQEATAVESRGRISPNDLGIYDNRHIAGLARLVDFAHSQGAKMCIQLAHAGRKAWSAAKGHGSELTVGPSPIAFDHDWTTPHELTPTEIDAVVDAFQEGARRAADAGYDAAEIHGAHGYLIHQFLSPLSNQRTDAYGGSLQNRMSLLVRVVDAVRDVWPGDKPVLVRLSSTDWVDGGLNVDEVVQVARVLKEHAVDLIDCSSGGSSPRQVIPLGPGYQVPFAERVRREAGIATGAVGLVTTPEMAQEIIHNGRADLVFLGRELLRDPYWTLHAARHLGADVAWPAPYQRAKR